MTFRTTPPPNIQLKTTAQRRARIKPDMKAKLELEYKKNPKPDKKDKHRMALAFEMTDENVHFWFQNRRARASRESKKHSSIYGRRAPACQVISESLETSGRSTATQPSCPNTYGPTTPLTSSHNKNNSGSKPCLPHIFTLWEDTSPSRNALISIPFGIESSYLKWQANEHAYHST